MEDELVGDVWEEDGLGEDELVVGELVVGELVVGGLVGVVWVEVVVV